MRDVERSEAVKLFGTVAEPTDLAQKISGIKSKSFNPDAAVNGGGPMGEKGISLKLTDKEKKKIGELILNAKSLAEISRLEKALNEGRLPPGVVVD